MSDAAQPALSTAPARTLAALQAARDSFALQACLVLALHHLLWGWVQRAAQLPTEQLFAPSLSWSALNHPPFLLLLVAGALPLVLARERLSWASFADRGATRLLLLAPLAVFAWQFSLYAPNVFLAQDHVLDRLVLVALALGCAAHPGFVFPFVLWLTLILSQLLVPLPEGGWHWPDKRLPYDALVLFASFLGVRAFTSARAELFAFLVLCLTGATYSHAAISKLSLGPHPWSWLLDDSVAKVFVAAHAQAGWLRGLSEAGVLRLAGALDALAVPIAATTLAVELSGLALLWRRRVCVAALLGLIGLHVAIWATSGIFFWKWIVFDAALLAFVLRLDWPASGSLVPGVERRVLFGASLAIMLATRFLFWNVDFAWYDSRLSNFVELRALGQSGASYRLDPRWFAPYDVLFAQSRFYYLVPEPVLAGTYGTVRDHALMLALDGARPEDLPALRARFGRTYFDPRLRELFARAVAHQLKNARARGDRHHALHALAAPYHFQRSAAPDTWEGQEPLRAVEVRWREWLYTPDALHAVSDRVLFEIPIEPVPPAAR